MKRYWRYVARVAMLFAVAACDDSILDVGPPDQLSDDQVFSDAALAEAFVNDIYRGTGHGLNGTKLFILTDDGHNTRSSGGPQMRSELTPTSLGTMGGSRFSHYNWAPLYRSIRQTNVFLEQIDQAEFDPAVRDRLKGEVLFLRAFFYHNLLRVYGGVPIITQVYGLNDDFEAARNSFAETVDFIVADLDAAAALLPLSYPETDLGRATRGAALALKSRVLTTAASDLYHENPSGMAETGYTEPQDRQAMWRAARDAAQAVIDVGIYELYRANPAPGDDLLANQTNLWLELNNSEFIFARYWLRARGSTDIPNVGVYDGPNGYHNWGSNTPTQNLVDAYRMADGSKFDWNDPEHAANPYANRDPRFYSSIHFDGARWVERPPDVLQYDSVGILQTFRQLTLPDGTVVPGVDSRFGPIEDWNGTWAGYYKRKAIDPAVDHQYVAQEVPWVFIRFAEILFNHAEASIELGDDAEAIRVLDLVRTRAGMPGIEASLPGSTLEEEFQNEKRIEMAFEELRYFDARRWMIAPELFGEDAKGIDITVKAIDYLDRGTYFDYTYTIISVEEREWLDKMYFFPIQRDEINRNPLLVQNPGY